MRNALFKYFALLCLAIACPINATAEEAPADYWYEVTIRHGDLPFEFYGSSKLDNKSFMSKVAAGKFVRLDNLMFRQKKEKSTNYIAWNDWDPLKANHIYLNVSYIIAVHPLKGNPNQFSEDLPKRD